MSLIHLLIYLLTHACTRLLDVEVEIDGEKSYSIPLLAKYYKPLGVLSVMVTFSLTYSLTHSLTHSLILSLPQADNYGRENLAELVVEYPFLKSMHPVGRLDADTTGLLLFSSDGHLTQTLLNPNSDIEREYEALVVGHVNASVLSEQLFNGVKTTEGTAYLLTDARTHPHAHSLIDAQHSPARTHPHSLPH